MLKKGGKYIGIVKILRLDVLKHVIENTYTIKKDDKDDKYDDNDDNKSAIDTGKELLHPIAISQN
jgi:hypothetical protein